MFKMKSLLFYIAHFLQLIFLFLAGLMLVVHLEQNYAFLSFGLFGYKFYYLGPSYLGIFCGMYKSKLNWIIDQWNFQKEVFGTDHGTVSMAFPKKQMFIMGSFAFIMEVFMIFRGYFPEKNLKMVGIACIVLYIACRIIKRVLYVTSIRKFKELD